MKSSKLAENHKEQAQRHVLFNMAVLSLFKQINKMIKKFFTINRHMLAIEINLDWYWIKCNFHEFVKQNMFHC